MTVRISTADDREPGAPDTPAPEDGRRWTVVPGSFSTPRHAWLDHVGTGEEARPPGSTPEPSPWVFVAVKDYLESGTTAQPTTR
ncbi:hypothetical protein [Amycolatopsis sp. CA-230715]|uniref:hypothetical protein n=1 Tax=Amycolatopsis sp. CA-230715 TaxID=2745196 RepID=UPI001C026372|nr:hypothetical protein [Amycolatopsis sp. CA-230715]QWF81279.1 hypothetical protein HUW46_04709 [Amycolatopsis sp. CA-230715]